MVQSRYNPNRPMAGLLKPPPMPQMNRNPLGTGGMQGGLAVQPTGPQQITNRIARPQQMQQIQPLGAPQSTSGYPPASGYPVTDFSGLNPVPPGQGFGTPSYQSEYGTDRLARLANRAATPAEIALEQQILASYQALLDEVANMEDMLGNRTSGAYYFIGGI